MKLLGVAAAAVIAFAVLVVGHDKVSSDPTTSPSSPPGAGIPGDQLRNPFEPYDPGRSGIAYDQLSAADKAGVDAVQETTETSQPDSTYHAFATAVDWTSAHAEQQIAARAVGLVGSDQEGVIP